MVTGALLVLAMFQGVNDPAGPGRARRDRAVAAAVATAPRLDGRLDDPAWTEATPFGDLTQRDPDEGRPGSEPTEIRIVHAGGALYVAIRAFDSRPDLIAAPLSRRDEAVPGDWVGVIIDSYHDRRSAFEFSVNPAGVKRDVFRFNDVEEDPGWNAVWDAATARDERGWTAELRIPVSQLKVTGAERTFGLNVFRRIHRRNELMYWAPLPRNASGVVSLFGTLEGVEGLGGRRPLEVAPYVLATSTLRPAGLANPFERGASGSATMGADLRIGLTSGLTLTAAVNPDFGQVDADPAELNLSGFESFFAERRPFFTEGVDLFQFPLTPWGSNGDNLFYSRRIGRAPQLEADDRGGHVEPAGPARILGAGKLTGRAGAWQVGLLSAVTSASEARVVAGDGTMHEDVVEPATAYLVGRLTREWRGGQTVAGLFGTGMRRSLDEAGADQLRRGAVTLGADLVHRFRNDTWLVRGSLVGSRVHGTPDALVATQRNAVHRFQRPDQDFSAVDSSATSLGGLAGLVQLRKQGGGSWLFGMSGFGRSPGFESNDVGFQRWAGRYVVESGLTRRWLAPTGLFRTASARVGQWGQWTWGGERFDLGMNLNLDATLHSFWNVSFDLWRGMGGLDVDALRGGPGVRWEGNWWSGMSVESDPRSALRFGLSGEAWANSGEPTRGIDLSPRLTWRPSPGQEWGISPGLGLARRYSQFVKRGEVAGRDEYIVGDLRTVTTRLTLRGNVTFSPTLTLQGYAEPFVATGEHRAFHRVGTPGSRDVEERYQTLGEERLLRDGTQVRADLDGDGAADIDLGAPDFSSLSFRSNLVLRWEYRPGSALFLVWQHGREHEDERGGYGIGQSWRELTRADAANVLMVKASFWLGR